jgi:hypothetical protein
VDTSKAWYTFPRIDNYGGVEPFGGFAKPDSNIQLPAGYPVTALLSGTVSSIDPPGPNVPDWGAVITIRLDVPVNAIATHTAYLHLASIAPGITTGVHVQAGQLIGYNGGALAAGTQKVPLGFALYNGDHYGFGPTWSQYLGSSALNPVPLLNNFASGLLSIPSYDGSIDNTSGGLYQSITNKVNNTLATVPGFSGIIIALDELEEFQPLQIQSQDSSNNDITLFGIDTHIPNPLTPITLPANNIQAVLIFIGVNTRAFLIRAFIVSIGLVILFAILMNALDSVSDSIPVGELLTAL